MNTLNVNLDTNKDDENSQEKIIFSNYQVFLAILQVYL